MPLTVEVLDRPEGFAAAHDEWNVAAAANADPNVFLTWDWLTTWWRHLGARHPGATPHVVTVRDGDGLLLAAPLFRTYWGYGPLRAPVLHQISYDAGDYGGVLLIRRPDEAVDALLDHLAEMLRHDVRSVVLSRLTTDSRFLATLRSRLATGRAPIIAAEVGIGDSSCPYAAIDDGYDLARRQRKHRVRQRLERFADGREITFTRHTGATLEAGLTRFVDLHRRRWEASATEMQGQLVDPAREAFLLDASRALDAVGHLRLVTLDADGGCAAANLDYEFAGRLYMFKTAFDPAHARFAPGHLLVSRVFEEGIARGVHEFDFMRGDHAYKLGWTNRARHLVTLRLTRPGLNGYLASWRTRAAQSTSRYLERTHSRRTAAR